MLLLAGMVALPAMAGTSCDPRPMSPGDLAAAADTALRVVAELDAADAPVAIVARVGKDLSRHGLVYSHAGFAVRDHVDGRWSVVHLLNDCGSDRSGIHVQGLVDFFADDLAEQDARIVWLEPVLAGRLAMASTGTTATRLHDAHYNLIARPGSRDFQNSTAWMLEMLGAAVAGGDATTRERAYATTVGEGFTPDRVRIAYSRRVLGGMFSANTHFADHSVATRLSGDYPVVTVRSILRYLEQAGHVARQVEWRHGVRRDTPGPA